MKAKFATLIGLCNTDQPNATWKEVVVYRDWSVVHVFQLVSWGRRLYRQLIFTTDTRYTLHTLLPQAAIASHSGLFYSSTGKRARDECKSTYLLSVRILFRRGYRWCSRLRPFAQYHQTEQCIRRQRSIHPRPISSRSHPFFSSRLACD